MSGCAASPAKSLEGPRTFQNADWLIRSGNKRVSVTVTVGSVTLNSRIMGWCGLGQLRHFAGHPHGKHTLFPVLHYLDVDIGVI